jgi:hypothetical protein
MDLLVTVNDSCPWQAEQVYHDIWLYTTLIICRLPYDDCRKIKSRLGFWVGLRHYYWRPQTRSMETQDGQNHWSSVVERNQVCWTTLLSIMLGHPHPGTSSFHYLSLLPDLARSWGHTVDAFFQFAVATGMSWLTVISPRIFNSIYGI